MSRINPVLTEVGLPIRLMSIGNLGAKKYSCSDLLRNAILERVSMGRFRWTR